MTGFAHTVPASLLQFLYAMIRGWNCQPGHSSSGSASSLDRVGSGRCRWQRATTLIVSCCLPWIAPEAAETDVEYRGSTFSQVKSVVFRQPYAVLPQLQVSSDRLGTEGATPGNHLRKAAIRTLSVQHDLYRFPGGQKLFQANGRCFAGRWRITRPSRYTGLFAPGTEALIIMRASVSLSDTTRGSKRAFALAGKVFPTTDPDQPVRTANFFAMENLLGTHDDHFLDAVMDNEPVASGLPGGFGDLFLGLRIAADLEAADEQTSGRANISFRPVTHLAAINVAAGRSVVAPHWLQLRASPAMARINAEDFRDELDLARYVPRKLVWDIRLAERTPDKTDALWKLAGHIELDEDIASSSCDSRLHFAHLQLTKSDK